MKPIATTGGSGTSAGALTLPARQESGRVRAPIFKHLQKPSQLDVEQAMWELWPFNLCNSMDPCIKFTLTKAEGQPCIILPDWHSCSKL